MYPAKSGFPLLRGGGEGIFGIGKKSYEKTDEIPHFVNEKTESWFIKGFTKDHMTMIQK